MGRSQPHARSAAQCPGCGQAPPERDGALQPSALNPPMFPRALLFFFSSFFLCVFQCCSYSQSPARWGCSERGSAPLFIPPCGHGWDAVSERTHKFLSSGAVSCAVCSSSDSSWANSSFSWNLLGFDPFWRSLYPKTLRAKASPSCWVLACPQLLSPFWA